MDIDIISTNGYPSSALSNFAAHKFVIDGVECASMEGFLQSLKFKDIDMQKHVCTLIGFKAKMKGKNKDWWKTQVLYWQGMSIDRHSKEYQDLLDRAYDELSKNINFRNALLATGSSYLRHSIGKSDASRTVLTEREFCDRLMEVRNNIR